MPKVAQREFAPYWETSDLVTVRLWLGDVLDVLRRLPARSVQCCITSPPYWGLRDYKTGKWEGGNASCDHKQDARPWAGRARGKLEGGINYVDEQSTFTAICGLCGALRVDQQIGSEETPEQFVAKMVAVFREVRRVLRDDGVLWLNLGDTYGGGKVGPTDLARSNVDGFTGSSTGSQEFVKSGRSTLPSGNLVGIPWRVALALQADGWVLRSDVPWVKRSAMPESVQNRPAKSLEYVFMLVKRMGYYFDMEAVRKITGNEATPEEYGMMQKKPPGFKAMTNPNGRAFRNADLWFESVETPHGLVGVDDELVGLDVTSEAYSGAHFATFPSGLIKPLILSSTSERGCCSACGAPWRRVVESKEIKLRPNSASNRGNASYDSETGNRGAMAVETKTVGWQPGCCCGAPTVPCTVLDPFVGSGTTPATAVKLGRRCWGIDLSETYLRDHAAVRVMDAVKRKGKLEGVTGSGPGEDARAALNVMPVAKVVTW